MAEADRILFKLAEPTSIEVPGDAAALAAAAEELLQQVAQTFGLPAPVSLLEGLDRDAVQASVDEARADNMLLAARIPNPLLCYSVDVDPSGPFTAEQLAGLVRELPPVQWAHVDGEVEAVGVTPIDDPASLFQAHLHPAPVGVGVDAAWGQTGGDGRGVTVGFVEAFVPDTSHRDLPASLTLLNPARTPATLAPLVHATATVGLVAAVDNTADCIGVAPSSRVVVGNGPRPGTILSDRDLFKLHNEVGLRLRRGDVLNISMGAKPRQGYFPLDFVPAHRTTSAMLEGRGIAVVEAAGNGTTVPGQPCSAIDLDGQVPAPLVPSNSAAIVVGAVGPGAALGTFARWGCSDFGNRVDCCAPGGAVVTLTAVVRNAQGIPIHTFDTFAGTSMACAIVSGVIATMQGIRKARSRATLRPAEIKAIFRDAAQTSDPAPGGRVGRMPDLARIVPLL